MVFREALKDIHSVRIFKSPLLALGYIFLLGAISLSFQIISIHIVFLFFFQNSQAFGLTISAFLAGLGVSSLLFSRELFKAKYPESRLVYLLVGLTFYGFFVLFNYQWLPIIIGYLKEFGKNQFNFDVVKAVCMWLYLFIPALFIGAIFPISNELAQHFSKAKLTTPIVYSFDLFGSVLGALACGYLLLPILGIKSAILSASITTGILALLIVPGLYLRIFWILCLFIMVMQLNQTSNRDPLASKWGDILFQKESPFGKITVGGVHSDQGFQKTLFINYRSLCTEMGNESERDLGYLSLGNLPQNSRVLIIGLGCGFTLDAIVSSSKVAKVDMIEINPVIAHAAVAWFSESNHNALYSPKTHLELADGADILRNTKEQYDAILIDVEEVNVIYSSPLFTKEIFEEIKRSLKPRGIFAMWSFNVSPEFNAVLSNTLSSVFQFTDFRLRANNGDILFFGGTEHLKLPPASQKEVLLKQAMSDLKIDSINTLNNAVLAQYYDVTKTFKLPKEYNENFFTK